jgi:glutamate carboxypeptidase
MRSIIATALLLGGAPMAHAALSPAEQKISATVEAGYEPTVALLEKIVNQNSGSMNLAGVKAVADMLRPEYEALGFTVSWVPMDAAKRAGHLVAVHKGKAGSTKMLLIGHLDTVFEPDSPFQTFKRDGDFASGPGVSDDKGGVATMILALKAMQAAGTLKNANIEVVLTGDEEDAGDPVSISRADLVAAGKRADVALDFEGLSQENGKDMGPPLLQ